jgi:hypothetical protein
MRFSEEKKWQKDGVTNLRHELFKYLRSSPFLEATNSGTASAYKDIFGGGNAVIRP